MKILNIKRNSKQIKNFNNKEWKIYDQKHYGPNIKWKSGKFTLVAREGKRIVGLAKYQYDGGVIHLKSIIVAKDFQYKGIGKALMKYLEDMAKKLKCHKIFLYTGKEWEANKFYQSIGYIKTSDLPNHFMNKDFVEYTKFIV